jgi:cyclic pyranopterin phosphate synthase
MADKSKLTHFTEDGAAHMVDVSAKDVSERVAVAGGRISMSTGAFAHVKAGTAKKGDVLGAARLAGIMAAKKTSDLIPLCHPLSLSKVEIDFDLDAGASAVEILATVKVTGKTGVEMEALTAASVAALTIYDMLKAVDKGMVIGDIRLLKKSGGRSGLYEAG